MNNSSRLDSLLDRQQRGLTLDTIFALIVTLCLLVSIAGLSTTARTVPAFAAQSDVVELTAECSTLVALSSESLC